ncbi:hypothetical protein BZG36_00845 [Bifiguratus adelaidae]|uniref:RING-type domain-containing protein n=1 Tax=Bifiguratus adelaidae TaxID=1938954 RepID=A0A261Y6L5_9FUNG|nr:hypothetical protein BZG36_00845 [Bifiguratus adelaidae]
MNPSELSSLSVKQLRAFLVAYNIATPTAVEKSDLVKCVSLSIPVSNEREKFYRSHLKPHPPKGTQRESARISSASRARRESPAPAPSRPQQHRPPQIARPSSATPPSTQHEGGGLFEDLFTEIGNGIDNLFRGEDDTPSHQRPPQQSQQQHQQQGDFFPFAFNPFGAAAGYPAPNPSQYNQYPPSPFPPHPQQYPPPPTPSQQSRGYPAHHQGYRPYTPTNQQPPGPAPYPPSPPSNAEAPSLFTLLQAKIDPSTLSIKTLKTILKDNHVEHGNILEKSELVSKVQTLIANKKVELEEGESETKEDNLCRICFDAQQNCVFLDCGHLACCMECAKAVVAKNNECPICKESIRKLVHVFRT